MRILNVVDKKGNVVGEETRENIHKKGLLHREVHVWYYTPKGEIIFQLRGKNKDTFPNLLDATVGGHVEVGDTFEEAAIREMREETGVKAEKKDLRLATTLRLKSRDNITDMTNNVLRRLFAYEYKGKLTDLVVEGKRGQGFEAWSAEKLVKGLNKKEKERFIPSVLNNKYIEFYEKILKLQ